MKLIAGFLIIGTLLSTCGKKDEADNQPDIDFSSDKKAVELIQSDNLFALDLFNEVSSFEENENFMISPLSVAIALGMTYNGADGETKSAFEESLRLAGFSRHEINRIHGELIRHLLTVDPKVTMEIANSLWVDQKFTLQQEFADTNRHYYDAGINSLNFNDPSSVDIINNWVSENTHEKITKILDQIPPMVAMYLINAIYYYGTWKYEFDEEDNRPINFNYSDGTSGEVEGMRMQEELLYYDHEIFRIADLPYGNDKYSMMIMLPKGSYDISDITANLTIDNWNEWNKNLQETELKLHMPKFKFEYKTLLNDALKNMGLGVAFGDNADLSLMVEEPADLFISRVLHKTFVDVNEKGTEAAAVTAVEVSFTSVGGGDSVIPFLVDRPFLFVIREKTSNALVFMGKVGRPQYN